MLGKYIAFICLSLACSIASAGSLQQEPAKPAEASGVQMEGSVNQLPVTDRDVQLAFFAGLSVVFVLMVGTLFRKYRGRRRGALSPKEAFNEDYIAAGEGVSFTPTFFTSESTPAILVAENQTDLRLFITNMLRLNYRVITSGDGTEACARAMEVVPDLIITNKLMPGTDGPTLAQRLKATVSTSHIPIIILTSSERDLISGDWHRFADDILHTSFDAKELLMRVNNLILARKRSQEENRRLIRAYPQLKEITSAEQAFLARVLHELERSYRDPSFGVEQLTSRLGLTRLQLYRKMKALTTFTPGDFIRQYRLEHAKQFLRKEGASISEVAAKTGFANITSFSKTFRDYTGSTPVQFVERHHPSGQSLVESSWRKNSSS